MVRYEIKKIFSKASYKISLLLLIIVTLVVSWLSICSVSYVNEEGTTTTGFSAIRALREQKQKWEGPITEEVLRQVIRENQAINASPEYNSSDVQQRNIAYSRKQGFMDIRDMISRSFCAFREYNYYLVDSLKEDDMSRFYNGRTQALKTWLYSDEATDRFTEAEKTFLINRYQELETPYQYAYSDGWEAALELSNTVIVLSMLFISFYVSGIFSKEKQDKADAIFFSTKLGRTAAVRAKVAAGFLLTTVVYWAAVLLYSLIVLTITGFGGGDCPIQIWIGGWKSYYNLSFIELYILTIFGGWIGTLAITGIAMTISAKTHSSVLAVSVPFILLFLPSFLGNLDSFSGLLALLPEQLLTLNTVVCMFKLYTIGEIVVSSIPILLAVYSVVYLLLLPLMYSIYRKTQLA